MMCPSSTWQRTASRQQVVWSSLTWGTLALAVSKVHYLMIITVDPYIPYYIIVHEWIYIWTQMQECIWTMIQPPPFWAEFCLTLRDSIAMLWLIIVVHILCFRSNHWIYNWKNIKHTNQGETSLSMARSRHWIKVMVMYSVYIFVTNTSD